MNPLNTRFNKAGWSGAINALVVLINGRIDPELALSTIEQGLVMTILTFLVVLCVPNWKAPPPKTTGGIP